MNDVKKSGNCKVFKFKIVLFLSDEKKQRKNASMSRSFNLLRIDEDIAMSLSNILNPGVEKSMVSRFKSLKVRKNDPNGVNIVSRIWCGRNHSKFGNNSSSKLLRLGSPLLAAENSAKSSKNRGKQLQSLFSCSTQSTLRYKRWRVVKLILELMMSKSNALGIIFTYSLYWGENNGFGPLLPSTSSESISGSIAIGSSRWQ